MAKSRHRKNHKQKTQARKNKIKDQKNKVQKMQRDFIMNLIKNEQEKGLFNNTQNIDTPVSSPIIEGPSI